jgi:6-pyruvoyltetrahydropterin/6-carboxytetrahydropterin synthase
MSRYRVRIEKDYTVFCAGHFITYDGHECEPLHGHNYRAAVALEGPLDENAYVFDFTRLKRALRAVVDRLDHRMLLPTKSALIRVSQSGTEIQASYRDKRYVFPASDVVLLPVPNTTAEMLAWWIAQELRQSLDPFPPGAEAIEVEVDESSGQRAFYREPLGREPLGEGGRTGPERP